MQAPASRRLVIGLAALLVGASGCLHAPMPWSPDGAWLAYPVAARAADGILAPGWLFAPGPALDRPPAAATGYRLWATKASSGASVLLEESAGPITAPGWSPDGRALAFGRVVPEAEGRGRFEVVILEGLTRRRVVSSRPIGVLDAEVSRLPFQALAWSPDGRYLAVPQLEPNGLAIIRADNGRVVNSIPDAFLPSWSPAGGKLAFFLRSGGHALHCIDSALGQPRLLCDVGQAGQAPAWTRDGSAIFTVARRPPATRPEGPGARRSPARPAEPNADQFDLVRVRVDAPELELIYPLKADAAANLDAAVEGTSLTFDRDGENLFSSNAVEGVPNQVTWFHPRDGAVYKKFHPVDYSLPIGSLAVTPDGRTLAARVGGGDRLSPPLLCDLAVGEPRARLIAPDDPARLEWVATLARTAWTVLAKLPAPTLPAAVGPPMRLDRPTILPVVTELIKDPEAHARLRRIGRIGRPLCDRPAGSPEPSAATRQVLAEARLFFDYLKEDYAAALEDLGPLEDAAATPEHRVALLTIRAQTLINLGQVVSARRVIGYLERLDGPPSRRIEWTASGYELTPERRADRGWPRYLVRAASRALDTLEEADRPEPGPDFAPSRGPLFPPAQPQVRPAPPFLPPAGPDRLPPAPPIAPRFRTPRG